MVRAYNIRTFHLNVLLQKGKLTFTFAVSTDLCVITADRMNCFDKLSPKSIKNPHVKRVLKITKKSMKCIHGAFRAVVHYIIEMNEVEVQLYMNRCKWYSFYKKESIFGNIYIYLCYNGPFQGHQIFLTRIRLYITSSKLNWSNYQNWLWFIYPEINFEVNIIPFSINQQFSKLCL